MKTEIIAITDRSGSMSSIRDDVNGGFDAFIAEQRKIPGEARVTQVLFDDRIETIYQGIPLDQVPPMDLHPRGSTALFDAIGQTLEVQGKRIRDEAWADTVIVTIITDGGENASREYSQARVTEMVKHAEDHGWKFVFLAANQDAFAAAANVGITRGFAANFAASAQGASNAYATMSVATTALRSATP